MAVPLALTLAACGGDDDGPAAEDGNDSGEISRTGSGEASMPPDTVMATLDMTFIEPDLESAQAEAASRMDAAIPAISNRRVEDIMTTAYAIDLERDSGERGLSVTGYQVIHTVTFTVRKVACAGEVIQAAVDAAANNVQNVWFVPENVDAALDEARELAVNDARNKATELADHAVIDLGQVMSVTESTVSSIAKYVDEREVGLTLTTAGLRRRSAPERPPSTQPSR